MGHNAWGSGIRGRLVGAVKTRLQPPICILTSVLKLLPEALRGLTTDVDAIRLTTAFPAALGVLSSFWPVGWFLTAFPVYH